MHADDTLVACRIQTGLDIATGTDVSASHAHVRHELLWHVAGTFRVDAAGRSWLVAPGAGVWLPANTPHRVVGAAYRAGWAFVDVGACPQLWTQVSPIVVSPLLRALLGHLPADLADADRGHVEQVVFDLLQPHTRRRVPGVAGGGDQRRRRPRAVA